MSYIKAIIEAHRFFVTETPSYVAGHRECNALDFGEKMYYPIAYCKFMGYAIIGHYNKQN